MHSYVLEKFLYVCPKVSCACRPNEWLCGRQGSIDLTDWMNDAEEGPKGPGTFSCQPANHSWDCQFSGKIMNDLLQKSPQ